jgi:hypothetical protein
MYSFLRKYLIHPIHLWNLRVVFGRKLRLKFYWINLWISFRNWFIKSPPAQPGPGRDDEPEVDGQEAAAAGLADVAEPAEEAGDAGRSGLETDAGRSGQSQVREGEEEIVSRAFKLYIFIRVIVKSGFRRRWPRPVPGPWERSGNCEPCQLHIYLFVSPYRFRSIDSVTGWPDWAIFRPMVKGLL